jgi:hypothetical protein
MTFGVKFGAGKSDEISHLIRAPAVLNQFAVGAAPGRE